MGVVYYARYLEYFEQARTELLNNIGIVVTKIEDAGYYMPVVKVTANYKEGARFENEIVVRTMIKEVPKARMTIYYEVFRKSDNKLLVTGQTIHGFIEIKDGKPKRPPKVLVEKLISVISD
jgi:acyl-CoA thioester hydrolase